LAPGAARAELTAATLGQFEKTRTTFDQIVAKLGQPARTERNVEGLEAIAYSKPGATLNPGVSLFKTDGSLDRSIAAIFVFDKARRLVDYRAISSSGDTVTSEDGAGPMPNIDTAISAQQSKESIAATVADGKPHLGIQFIPTSATDAKHQLQFAQAKFQGMIVVKVLPDSVAQKAGIKRDDYISLLNGFLVTSFDDVTKAMAEVKSGQTIRIHVLRIDQSKNEVGEQIFDLKF
jgi:hypothetical protein